MSEQKSSEGITKEQEEELLIALRSGEQELAIQKCRDLIPSKNDSKAHDIIRDIQNRHNIPIKWRKKDMLQSVYVLVGLVAVLAGVYMFSEHKGNSWTVEDFYSWLWLFSIIVGALVGLIAFMSLGMWLVQRPKLSKEAQAAGRWFEIFDARFGPLILILVLIFFVRSCVAH